MSSVFFFCGISGYQNSKAIPVLTGIVLCRCDINNNDKDDMSHHSFCTAKAGWHLAKFRFLGPEKPDGHTHSMN